MQCSALFDTRLSSALAGGAGYGIAHTLHRHCYDLVKNPEGFILEEAHGPLHTGEIERAKEWGAQLVRASVGKNGRLGDLGQVGGGQRVVPPWREIARQPATGLQSMQPPIRA